MTRLLRVLARPWVSGLLVAGAVAVGFGLYWFQPWKLWVDDTVDEALPPVAAAPPVQVGQSAPAASAGPTGSAPVASASPAGPGALAAGEFISHEHATSGSARIVRLVDGSRILRLEDLDTSNGPALRVWLTDAPVKPGKDGWRVFDDGAHVNLGELKGNKGNQNYTLPADLDLARYTSVAIWCDRFDVSFGAAALTSTA
ncbi:DM13 domain-containing protein [Embleya sp. NBC_00896]|uniref:DM13 domain-containing protein n=1 Tax=Embleya sp. NBC_00896 TaxID=2975961 RepID=UPI002F916896|nr:DM13 domain-containing protein [Embleya sp. NBC_00896]